MEIIPGSYFPKSHGFSLPLTKVKKVLKAALKINNEVTLIKMK
ncbi:hypothetical protein [Clostridium tagluense]|nr:hypothetical protein [Clostridium tagluense]